MTNDASPETPEEAAHRQVRQDYARLVRAGEVVAARAPGEVSLCDWTSSPGDAAGCGTVACAAGWMIRHPEFQDPDFRLDANGMIVASGAVMDPYGLQEGYYYAARVTGISPYQAVELFGDAEKGRMYDIGPAGEPHQGMTDQELFALRVANFLAYTAMRRAMT